MSKVEIKAIIEGTSTALSGVEIGYTVNGVAASGTTDDSGVLDISGLPAGNYTFSGVLTGYKDGSIEVAYDGTTDASGTISMEQKTLLEMLKSTALKEFIEYLESDYSNLMSQLNVLASDKIDALEAEETTTTSTWVKNNRNPLEIILLESLLITANTLGGTYLEKLVTRLKNLL